MNETEFIMPQDFVRTITVTDNEGERSQQKRTERGTAGTHTDAETSLSKASGALKARNKGQASSVQIVRAKYLSASCNDYRRRRHTVQPSLSGSHTQLGGEQTGS